MADRYAVDLEHVTRIYKRDEFEVQALDDVSVQVPEGRFVAIMGPSGSGKTTMLNLIAGIDHPTSGRVAVGGEEITGMKERDLAAWRARHIGLVFQFYNLIPVLTAFENVELPLLLTNLGKGVGPRVPGGIDEEAVAEVGNLIDNWIVIKRGESDAVGDVLVGTGNEALVG